MIVIHTNLDDGELKKAVKEAIHGEIKKLAREEIESIIQKEVDTKLNFGNANSPFHSLVTKQVKQEVTAFVRELMLEKNYGTARLLNAQYETIVKETVKEILVGNLKNVA